MSRHVQFHPFLAMFPSEEPRPCLTAARAITGLSDSKGPSREESSHFLRRAGAATALSTGNGTLRGWHSKDRDGTARGWHSEGRG